MAIEVAAIHAVTALTDALRGGPGITETVRAGLAKLSSEATEAGFKSLALALLVIGQSLDPMTKPEHVANNCESTAEFVTDPKERDILLRAAAALRRR